jgi:membrane-associated phospholipid phosphatase
MMVMTTACEGWATALLALGAILAIEVRWRGAAARFAPLALALIANGLIIHGLKSHWGTPRPLEVYGPSLVRSLVEPLRKTGFPSGHSSTIALAASYLVVVYGRRMAWTLAVAALGGFSRIYVGAHWVFDVLGGFVVGGGMGWALGRFVLWLGMNRARGVRAA